jgi:hypothetical protein
MKYSSCVKMPDQIAACETPNSSPGIPNDDIRMIQAPYTWTRDDVWITLPCTYSAHRFAHVDLGMVRRSDHRRERARQNGMEDSNVEWSDDSCHRSQRDY